MKTKFAHSFSANSTNRATNGHTLPTEAEIIADFDRQSDDFDYEYAGNHAMTPDPVFELASDPFEEGNRETERAHSELIKTLLLSFVDRNRSFSAEQICGPYAWNAFTDDEKYKAEYLISELITKLKLPLFPNHDHSYPAPRRYSFM